MDWALSGKRHGICIFGTTWIEWLCLRVLVWLCVSRCSCIVPSCLLAVASAGLAIQPMFVCGGKREHSMWVCERDVHAYGTTNTHGTETYGILYYRANIADRGRHTFVHNIMIWLAWWVSEFCDDGFCIQVIVSVSVKIVVSAATSFVVSRAIYVECPCDY